MNKIYKYLLMSALVCTLGLSVTSCSDDDEKVDERIVTEDGKTYVPDSLLTDQERYQLACQFAVIGTLHTLTGLERVSLAEVTNTTHEPTYGMTLDDAGATVRVMKCESTAAAELSFRAIASLDSADAVRMYTPTADGYVLNLKDLPILADGKKFTLGTLTFHRDGGPRRYGWVDVDIPCIPHLERIDYLGPDAFPDNANCPYQIGDIVWVYKDHGLCSGYYVCVATNGYRSTLCHMNKTPNPGGDESINADGDDDGCWKPYNNDHGHATTVEDIKDYVSFMAEKKALVTNIKAYLNGKAYNKKPSVSGKLWHIFPDGFNNDKGVVFNLNDSKSAYVYYDAYITDEYAVSPPYNYRIAKYAVVPNNCTSESQVWTGSKTYVKDTEWDDWLGGNDYTMNVIHTSSVLSYATLDYSALNDPLQVPLDIGTLTSDYEAQDGDVLTGTLSTGVYGKNLKISIANGATVALAGVTINGFHDPGGSFRWAGITCEGDATIILSGKNTVRGFFHDYPGIYVPENCTLTIEGDGDLTAEGGLGANGFGAGIGGGYYMDCGAVVIKGGNITARGGERAAGIGSGRSGSCGGITITGGTVAATGCQYAAGIGSGYYGSCKYINIGKGVTRVTATKGSNAPYSVGPGYNGSVGTVTIGGTVTIPVATSPYTYKSGDHVDSGDPMGKTVDLGKLTSNYEAKNGDVLTGVLTSNVMITIADYATVTLHNVTINGENHYLYEWAGITCWGNATLVLSGTNTIRGFLHKYPGIYIAQGRTLTIKGNGSLNASSNYSAAGIGGGYYIPCGNIVIEGGTITANGGEGAAGIGGGRGHACGNITITDGVTSVTATKGRLSPNSIGQGFGYGSSVGQVTIGGKVTGSISESPYTYRP